LGEEILASFVTNWDEGERGNCTVFYLHNYGDALPNGPYFLEIYVDADLRLIGAAETAVGGTGSVAVTGTAGGVNVSGQVLDADSGKPISGAGVFILKPNVDLDGWLDDPIEAGVFAYAETDKNGQFQLAAPLARGQAYPGIVYASGYRVLDGYLDITADDPDAISLTLELTR
jgi:hypothetical protein